MWVICVNEYLEDHDSKFFVQKTSGHSKYTYAQSFLYFPMLICNPLRPFVYMRSILHSPATTEKHGSKF